MPPRRSFRESDLVEPPSRRANLKENSHRDESAQPSRRRRTRRQSDGSQKSRWPRRIAIGLLLLVGFVMVAPNMIGWLGLQQSILSWAFAKLDGRISVDSVSLGWFQPIKAGGIQLTDHMGEVIGEIESVRSSQRLIGLLLGSNLGEFEIVRPKLSMSLRPGGSNLEDAISRYLTGESTESATKLPAMTVSIVDASIEIVGKLSNEFSAIEKLNCKIQTATSDGAVTAQLDGQMSAATKHGAFQVALKLDANSKSVDLQNGSLSFIADQLPLGALSPILQRVLGRSQLGGELTGKCDVSFAEGGRTFSGDFAQLCVVDGLFAAPDLLRDDTLRLAKLAAGGKLSLESDTVTAEAFAAECDFGRVNVDGQFALKQFQQMLARGQFSPTPFRVDGSIDLAKVASQFASTLRVYNDLRFESGEMQFQFQNRPGNGVGRILVNIDTTNIVAQRGGQRIAWQQPFRVVGDVVQDDNGLHVDELSCQSDFIDVQGKADLRQGELAVQGDLAKLLERAAQFVDVSSWKLAGGLKGGIAWSVATVPAGSSTRGIEATITPINWSGQFAIAQPVVGAPGMTVWRESEMRLSGQGTAAVDANNQIALNEVDASIQIGLEQVNLKLLEPIPNIIGASRWVMGCNGQGSLAGWLRQIESFVDLGSFKADGNSVVNCKAVFEYPILKLENVEYRIEQFAFDGYGMSFVEPRTEGQATIFVDLGTSGVSISEMTLASSSIAARGENLNLAFDDTLVVAGNVGFRGDVNRLANWFGLSAAADSVHYFGTAEGAMTLSSDVNAIHAQIEATIPEMLAARQVLTHNINGTNRSDWQELLKETNIKVGGQVSMSQDFSHLFAKGLTVDCSSLALKADGSIADIANTCKLDVAGTWSPQWDKINGLLAAYSHDMVQLTGRETQAFSIRGPLFDPTAAATATSLPTGLEITTELGWEQGTVCKFPVGQANVDLQVAGGVARLDTGMIPFSGGTIRVAPTVDLRAVSPVVQLDPGAIATKVALTPEICRDWLKFVAPLLADVTTAQGFVSLQTEGVRIPLADPIVAEARGTVQLEEVVVGAGPLAEQIIGAVQGIRALLKPGETGESKDRSVWMRVEQQSVPFAIQDRRVHHEGLTLHLKDVTIRTRGSVGFDQSLSMIIDVPIADGWLGTEPWLQGLKGQSLQFPVGGTVTRPQLDKKAIQQLSMQLVQRTAANQLNNVVSDQTQKLQNKLGGELDKAQNSIRDKFKSEVTDKLPTDVQSGLDKLLGPLKKDK